MEAIIERNGERLRLIRERESGINTYQVVDESGNDWVNRKYDEYGTILDYGIRLIKLDSRNIT